MKQVLNWVEIQRLTQQLQSFLHFGRNEVLSDLGCVLWVIRYSAWWTPCPQTWTPILLNVLLKVAPVHVTIHDGQVVFSLIINKDQVCWSMIGTCSPSSHLSTLRHLLPELYQLVGMAFDKRQLSFPVLDNDERFASGNISPLACGMQPVVHRLRVDFESLLNSHFEVFARLSCHPLMRLPEVVQTELSFAHYQTSW